MMTTSAGPRRLLRLFLATLALLWLAMPGARANTCTAAMTDVDFGVISPLENTDYTARGTLTVTCNWTLGSRRCCCRPPMSASTWKRAAAAARATRAG